jgi:hypothetical protein
MKRNWDVIREILCAVEAIPSPDQVLELNDFDSERRDEISYHARLLLEAGLAEGRMIDSLSAESADFYLSRLTWVGHDLLDSIRSDTVWEKTKDAFASKGLDMTFELLKSVAVRVASSLVGVA